MQEAANWELLRQYVQGICGGLAALCRDAATGQHALPGIRRFLETFSLLTASILT
jgi:hypothetical protein